MALSAATPMASKPPREVRRALWIFWCAFIVSSIVNRILLIDVLTASPSSVLAIVVVKSLLCVALSLQMTLRAAPWARTGFAILFAVDAVDTVLNAWLLLSVPHGLPHVQLQVGSEIAFDAVFAYAVFLLFSEPSALWFGVPRRARKPS